MQAVALPTWHQGPYLEDAQALAHAPQLRHILCHLLDCPGLVCQQLPLCNAATGAGSVQAGWQQHPLHLTLPLQCGMMGSLHSQGRDTLAVREPTDEVGHLRIVMLARDVVQQPQLVEVELLERQHQLHHVQRIALHVVGKPAQAGPGVRNLCSVVRVPQGPWW